MRTLDQFVDDVVPRLTSSVRALWSDALPRWLVEGVEEPDCDLHVERGILHALNQCGVDARLLSEETGWTNLGVTTTDWTFLLDPIDGTHNLLKGAPAFTSSLALFEDGVCVFGLVYSPVFDQTFIARRGQGAWRLVGDYRQRLRANPCSSLEQAVVTTFKPRTSRDIDLFLRIVRKCRKLRSMSCSSLEICLIACGSYDAFIDLREVGSERDCDVAAAALVLREAGGELLSETGEEMCVQPVTSDSITVRRRLVAAATRPLAEDILSLSGDEPS